MKDIEKMIVGLVVLGLVLYIFVTWQNAQTDWNLLAGIIASLF